MINAARNAHVRYKDVLQEQQEMHDPENKVHIKSQKRKDSDMIKELEARRKECSR